MEITAALLIKIIYGLLIITLCVVIFLGIELVRIVKNFRKISDRIEMLSDISSWFGFLGKIPSFLKKHHKEK
jgi:hypothetical protein